MGTVFDAARAQLEGDGSTDYLPDLTPDDAVDIVLAALGLDPPGRPTARTTTPASTARAEA